jgi:OOP family OmpA-OmpF porin
VERGGKKIRGKRTKCGLLLLLLAAGWTPAGLFEKQASALEVITMEDIKQERIPVKVLVKAADNGIMLFDTSASMNERYKDTKLSRVQILKEFLAKRAEQFPALDVNFGLYVYTPWDPIYPVQPMDKEKFLQAVGKLPSEGSGPTHLYGALEKLDSILAGLKGKTAVFLVTDGQCSPEGWIGKRKPADMAKELAEKYNICFYIVSTAEKEKDKRTLDEIAAVNECSRVIPFDVWLARPEYNTGAMYVVKSTEKIVTVTEERIVGLQTDDILFAFDNENIAPPYQEELNAIGDFLRKNPQTFVIIHGYADTQGDAEYNMKLSKRRAEAVANHLRKGFNLPENRMVVMWYGDLNPVATNETEEGRAKNRRVEIGVGGLSKEAP